MTTTHRAVALQAESLTQRFGGLTALDDVTFEVEPGGVHGVIGPNGAGKTTLLNVLSGLQRPTSGTFRVGGDPAGGWPAHRIVREARLVRTFQTVRLFGSMTVRQHLEVASRAGASATSRSEQGAAVQESLERLRLVDVADEIAVELPYGTQRRVELARAISTKPRLLLLDEPAAGLTPEERRYLARDLKDLTDDDVTVVLIEHHMDLVKAVCQTACVLNFGRVISDGPIDHVMNDPVVIEAYIGSGPTRKSTTGGTS